MNAFEKIKQSKKCCKLLAVSGIVFIIFFNIVISILSVIRQGYNPLTQYISALGETGAPNAAIASIMFIISGILLLSFSIGLYVGIKKEKYSFIGPFLIAISATVDLIGSGIFPCDPGCAGATTIGRIHLLISIIGGIAVILAPFFIWRSLKKDELWQKYDTFSLIIGVLMILMFGVFMISYSLEILIGLTQRISSGIFNVWILILAIKLFKLSDQLSE